MPGLTPWFGAENRGSCELRAQNFPRLMQAFSPMLGFMLLLGYLALCRDLYAVAFQGDGKGGRCLGYMSIALIFAAFRVGEPCQGCAVKQSTLCSPKMM